MDNTFTKIVDFPDDESLEQYFALIGSVEVRFNDGFVIKTEAIAREREVIKAKGVTHTVVGMINKEQVWIESDLECFDEVEKAIEITEEVVRKMIKSKVDGADAETIKRLKQLGFR